MVEKICPIMSRPDPHDDTKIAFIDCQKEKCQLWVEVNDINSRWMKNCSIVANLTNIQAVKGE